MKTWGLLGLVLITLALYGCAPLPGNTPAVSSDSSAGGTGDLYPPQDLSVVAKTNRVQFLNVYANW